MIGYLSFAIVLFVFMFISSLILVFFIRLDEDETRYYEEQGLKIPLEWLRKEPLWEFQIPVYYDLILLFGILIPYILAFVISFLLFNTIVGNYTKLEQIILVIIYFPIYKITVKLYNYLKKRGKLKYKKFKFENETDNSESKK